MDSISFALGGVVVTLDALGQRDLFDGGEQRHLAHLDEVHAHRVAARRLHREVELGPDLVIVVDGVVFVARDRDLALEDVDAEVGQRQEQLVELLDGEVHIVQRRGDLGAAQAALHLALFDEPADFLALEQRPGGGVDVVCG